MDKKAFWSNLANGNTSYARRNSDFYPTPPDVTYALLDFLGIDPDYDVIWEPACGEGHMVSQMQRMGYSVIGTDIVHGTNFLTDAPPKNFNWIVTNPPFSLSEQFIRRCVELKRPFALLLKSQYWHAKKRLELFRENPPTYILPLTWRPDFCFGERGGSPTMEVMWCVWCMGRLSLDRCMYIPLDRPDKKKVEVGF